MGLSVLALGLGCGNPPVIEPEAIDTTTTIPQEEPDEQETEPVQPQEDLKESQFKTVYFDFDKFNLRSDAKAALDHNFGLLTKYQDVIVKIEGHCDERGTVEYNLSLGEKRARAAMDYLVGLGIKTNRVSVISYGKERPVDPRHNEEAWAKNRRDEFRIISQ
jgi:peptidoglycan-associated lipoprotein